MRWLRAISATWRGLATTTSWPRSATTRLSHGERDPASSTTRARGRPVSTLLPSASRRGADALIAHDLPAGTERVDVGVAVAHVKADGDP